MTLDEIILYTEATEDMIWYLALHGPEIVDDILSVIVNSENPNIIQMGGFLKGARTCKDGLSNWQPLLTKMQETFHDHPLLPEMLKDIT